ncbi:MAG: hypothetical protein NG737_00050 [Omnitrophica bacterium]|nr:hypothetical protein [Candidatus Omnitrophota bacterium]
MKSIVIGLSVLLLVVSFTFTATAATRPSLPPLVIQEMGAGVVTYSKTVYPFFDRFSRYSGGEQRCVDKCNAVEGQPIEAAVFGAPFSYEPILSTTVNFTGVNGIGTEYRENTAMFITWTIRVIGSAEFMPLWTGDRKGVCQVLGAGNWHGYVYEEFIGGEVETRLTVNGTQQGNLAIMTIPFQGGIGVYTPSDPTITGSAYIRAKDFPGGRFPNTMNFEVSWLNHTSLTITSPLDGPGGITGNTSRNLIITIMPVQ